MELNDKDFLEENIGNYHSIQVGYLRNIEIDILNMYEALYRKYLNSSHYMCKYCKDDIFNTIQRLYEYYLALPQEEVQNLVQKSTLDVQNNVQPKRGRPKRAV